MHLQIRTSPNGVGRNIRDALDALTGVNVEGIGPEYETSHARIVVPHDATDDALRALEKIPGFEPARVPACTVALSHRPGQLDLALKSVAAAGFEVQSVLVLASRLRGMTLVSIGLDHEPTPEQRAALGCVPEPAGWIGGDFDDRTAGARPAR